MARRHAPRKPSHSADVTAGPQAAAASATAAADAMTRIACGQFECCLHAFNAMFRAFESMRSTQLEAARAARREHEAALARLEGASAPDVLGVAADLARFDTEGGLRYWQQLGEAMTRMQAELLECGARDLATLSERWAAALAVGGNGDEQHQPAPLGADFAALISRLSKPVPAGKTAGEAVASQAADVANEAWQRWMKLSEDWTRMALQARGAEGVTAH